MTEYKLIVAGGRDFNDAALLYESLDNIIRDELSQYNVSIVSGMAVGADKIGYEYARSRKLKVYAKPANWKTYGKMAGFIRNAEMASISEGLIAFWDQKSPGTKNIIDIMVKQEKDVWVVYY